MTTSPLSIRNREELASFLAARTEDEILVVVRELGAEPVLRHVFERTAEEYVPAEGPRERSVVQWEIEVPGEGLQIWQNVASREGFRAFPGEIEEPDVMLRMELMPFLGLMAGTVRGIEVLSSGALRLKGNLQLAMEMEAWFGLGV